jgi:hypothetical protein
VGPTARVPLAVSHKGVHRSNKTGELIWVKTAKLGCICDQLMNCRVVVEKPQRHQGFGDSHCVRIDMMVAPGTASWSRGGPVHAIRTILSTWSSGMLSVSRCRVFDRPQRGVSYAANTNVDSRIASVSSTARISPRCPLCRARCSETHRRLTAARENEYSAVVRMRARSSVG